uniref:Uncharacterized protein n=1 Tax=Lepeophtheirus salmonis TaxID=72036 RepID=A0A0K2U6A4_LEPSM
MHQDIGRTHLHLISDFVAICFALSNDSTFAYQHESSQWFVGPETTTSSSDTSWIITKWKSLLLPSI